MRILNVNALLDPVTGGGTAERTIQLTRFLEYEGVECSIVTTDLGLNSLVMSGLADLNIYAFPCIFKRFYVPGVRFSKLLDIVGQHDVVHLMGHWTVINALMYMAARIKNKPYAVCPAGALPLFGRSKMLKSIYNIVVGKKIVRNASAWISITNDEKSQFLSYGVDTRKITVIPNGVNASDFTSMDDTGIRKRLGLGGSSFILFLGRLNPIKGPDILLDAFLEISEKIPHVHLVFAGPDGGLKESLVRKTKKTAASKKVHFAGYVGGDDKSSLYHAADIVVIPSRQEAMSIVVLESGICGTPVIMTDVCGFPQMSEEGAAIEVKADVNDISGAIVELVGDEQKRSQMGKAAKEFVVNRYTWRAVAKQYLVHYNKLLATENTTSP